jgi:glycosyltransferase involved in cell wall biosynthesis
MKTAVVHDWLTGMRGGEKVLEAILGLLPQADVFTLFYEPAAVSGAIRRRRIFTSWLDRLPGARRHHRYFLPFFPRAMESFDLRGYDLVVSVSHAVAKGVNPRGARHVCYCETPMRYVWDFTGDYFRFGRGGWWKRRALETQRRRLREWDVRASSRVTEFLANSHHVAERIAQCYGRTARVLYPPVATDFFTPAIPQSPSPYLVVSALEPHKRVDLAVAAFARLGAPLLIAGRGTLESELRAIAPPNIKFLGWVSDEELRRLYRSCRALIFPGQEDFGIVPVEAQACGRPVVAYGKGGALETVLDGLTGVFFAEPSAESLADAVRRLEGMEFDPAAARRNSLRFSRGRFDAEMRLALAGQAEPAPKEARVLA